MCPAQIRPCGRLDRRFPLVVWFLFTFCVTGCDKQSVDTAATNTKHPFWVGQEGAGDGNEIAVIHLIVGDKSGPAGTAFCTGMANQSPGHPAVLVVAEFDKAVKPSTLLIAQVTADSMKAAKNLFGPVQTGVAMAVIDSISDGVISREMIDSSVLIVSVFIHPSASDREKLEQFNYEATKTALRRAMNSQPTAQEVEQIRKGMHSQFME